MENSNIAWTHHTQNFWLGCDKVAPECAHCYIDRTLRKMGRDSWGKLYRAVSTWKNPDKWEAGAASTGCCYRVFTNSLSDYFHAECPDPSRTIVANAPVNPVVTEPIMRRLPSRTYSLCSGMSPPVVFYQRKRKKR